MQMHAPVLDEAALLPWNLPHAIRRKWRRTKQRCALERTLLLSRWSKHATWSRVVIGGARCDDEVWFIVPLRAEDVDACYDAHTAAWVEQTLLPALGTRIWPNGCKASWPAPWIQALKEHMPAVHPRARAGPRLVMDAFKEVDDVAVHKAAAVCMTSSLTDASIPIDPSTWSDSWTTRKALHTDLRLALASADAGGACVLM